MKSYTSSHFWVVFHHLPKHVQRIAQAKFQMWKANPSHPSLAFKPLKSSGTWSVRINDNYRALGRVESDTVEWFWIGPHDEYEEWIKRL